MNNRANRRDFARALGFGVGAACLAPRLSPAAPARRLKIGHTFITWGLRPEDAEPAITDISSLGYHGIEVFGHVLEAYEPQGGLGRLLEAANLPLVSAYCTMNLVDPARRSVEVERIVRWGTLIQKYGGTVAVIGPTAVKRPSFNFAASKADIVTTLNEMCKALDDIGVVGVMHQHTGTSIEFRDEVYAVMEAVDTRYVKFGPDLGQLVKGGSNAVQTVTDFLPVIRHVHLKDFVGGPAWDGYCPLGQGRVGADANTILGLLEKVKELEYVMVELDPSPNAPQTPRETATESKKFLKGLGYTFRS
jgi:inosose dehydratase